MVRLDFASSAKRWRANADGHYLQAATYYAEANKAVMTTSTFFIGLLGVFLQINNDISLVSTFEKSLLIMIFILFLLADILGLLIFRTMNSYMNDAGEHYEGMANSMTEWMRNNDTTSGKVIPPNFDKDVKPIGKYSNAMSNFQLLMFGLATFLTVYYFISYLGLANFLPDKYKCIGSLISNIACVGVNLR